MDRDHFIVVRRQGQDWCLVTENGSTAMPSRSDAIEAAMRFASESSQGDPIRIEIADGEGAFSPFALHAIRTH